MASEVTEVNYLEVAEELCIYDVRTTKKGFLQSIPLKFVFKIRGASLSSGKQGQTVEKLRTLSHHL